MFNGPILSNLKEKLSNQESEKKRKRKIKRNFQTGNWQLNRCISTTDHHIAGFFIRIRIQSIDKKIGRHNFVNATHLTIEPANLKIYIFFSRTFDSKLKYNTSVRRSRSSVCVCVFANRFNFHLINLWSSIKWNLCAKCDKFYRKFQLQPQHTKPME